MGDVQVVYCLDYNQGGLGTRSCIMGLKTPDPRSQKEQSRANIEQDTAIQENLLRNLWIAGHLPRRLLYMLQFLFQLIFGFPLFLNSLACITYSETIEK